ncbi:MAG: ureidoglycolate lyase [Microbacteriaceae bacterium]|nr:ureidoglycolate lyase [Burkholderiaceae bacterium]
MPQALTDTVFAPFGRVLQVPADGQGGHAINQGTSQRFELVADALLTAEAGRPVVSISRALARVLPLTLVAMERHPLGSQSFVPLGAARRFALVVAAGRVPAEALGDHLQAFVSNGTQGVLLAPGTWHHGLLALDAGDYLVLERRGDAVDCDLADLASPVRLAWAG